MDSLRARAQGLELATSRSDPQPLAPGMESGWAAEIVECEENKQKGNAIRPV